MIAQQTPALKPRKVRPAPGGRAPPLSGSIRIMLATGALVTIAGFPARADPAHNFNADPGVNHRSGIQLGIDPGNDITAPGAGLPGGAGLLPAGRALHLPVPAIYRKSKGQGESPVLSVCEPAGDDPLASFSMDAEGLRSWHVQGDAPGKKSFIYRPGIEDGQSLAMQDRQLNLISLSEATLNSATEAARPGRGCAGPEDTVLSSEESRSADEASGMAGVATAAARQNTADREIRGSDGYAPEAAAGAAPGAHPGGGPEAGPARAGAAHRDEGGRTQPREIPASKSEWFIVGQADLTIGSNNDTGSAQSDSGESSSHAGYTKGRIAFYAKGETGNGLKVTASVDTRESGLQDVYRNLDRKDPSQLLRRLRTSQNYPVYGDDSSVREDAPTQGSVYIRVENEDNKLIIGNFVAQATGTELAQLDRGLFGGMVSLRTPDSTVFGERKAQVFAFASEPGTVPAREEFRGTGGSLYILKRQDLSVGSERVRIELRDRTNGIVLESHELQPFLDYDFDPLQGRLILMRPLASVLRSEAAVTDGAAGSSVPVLVVRYEYTPPATSLSGRTIGARGTRWIGEYLRLGATVQDEGSGNADQFLIASDIVLRGAPGTYLKAEVARSDGAGFGQSASVDGGLSFFDFASPGRPQKSHAWRSEIAVDLSEIGRRRAGSGTLSAYFEALDEGFSPTGRLTASDTTRWGGHLEMPAGTDSEVTVRVDALETSAVGVNRTASLDFEKRIDLRSAGLSARGGLSLDQRTPGLLFNSVQQGTRLDAGTTLIYRPEHGGWYGRLFGQATLDRDKGRVRNNRAGAGVHAALSQRLSLESEFSDGDGGWAMDLKLNRRIQDGADTYIGYSVFADQADNGLDPASLLGQPNRASLIAGSRHRVSDQMSVFGENRFAIGGQAPAIARVYGLTFDPGEHVSVTASLERGQVDDAQAGLMHRTAASMAVGLAGQDYRITSAVEMRQEIAGRGGQEVWLLRNSASFTASQDWRYLSELNIAWADADGQSIRAAEFAEASIGAAYRPVAHERLNGLARLHYFEDMGPLGQLTGSGRTESPKQVSMIFSADGNYRVTQRLTLGGKYGYRQGKVSLARGSADFVSSEAHLAVIRADYRVSRAWDVLAEGRALQVPGAKEQKLGALVAVYRHLGENVKLGAGYSWSDFSDNLTDQTYTSRGTFLNLVAAF
jgi:hypothetical protein